MRRLDFKYVIIIVLIGIVLILGIINSNIKKDNLNFFERFVKDSSYVVSNIVTSPIKFIKNSIKKHNEKEDIYKKYKELKEKYESIEFDEARIDELEKTNKALKDVLNIKKDLQGYTYLNSTVISRDVSSFYDTITIDKGTHSGVSTDMAIITNKGLIGKVIKTSALTSTVKLLSSDNLNMKISVKIKVEEDYLYGLLVGYDKDKKCYIVEGISNHIDVPLNSVVTTTGMSDVFPSGILIGKVKEVGADNFDLAKIIYVSSEVNYDDLEYVTILKRDTK